MVEGFLRGTMPGTFSIAAILLQRTNEILKE
jgi:hypothetical protein